jgi:hypothetical protein
MCRWIEGKRRDTLKAEIHAVRRWAERLAKCRCEVSIDLEIDAYFCVLATLVLLEDIDKLSSVLLSLVDAFRAISNEKLREQTSLAEAYLKLANELQSTEGAGKAVY